MTAPKKRNLAARMALWSAHHRKKAIFGWLAFVIVIFAISKFAVTQQTLVYETSGPGESGRADAILYDDFKQPAGESVLIQNPQLKAGSPAFRAVVKSVIDGVTPLPAVAKVESPFDVEDNSGLISDDQHSVLVPIEIKGLSDDASDKVDPIVDRVAEVQKANPDFTIGSFGESTNKAVFAAFMDDLLKAGAFSIPLTLIILLVAFGALVAAGIPLLLGLTAVLGTMGLVAFISQALPMSESVSAIILLIGLAVGVDYTMFYLKREREERAAGRSEEAALEAAAATSGRSVLISGCTVLVAMAGMLLTFDPGFVLRRCNDDGGRGRDARIADSAAGAAVQARRQRRPATCAFRPSAAPRRQRGRSGVRSSIASSGDRPCRSCWPEGFSSHSRYRRTSSTRQTRASTRIRRSCW